MNHFEIKVPKLASLILTHDLDGEIRGLNSFGDAHPPPLPMFFAFRIMVGMGMLMLATSWLGWWLLRRARWQPAGLPRVVLWLFAAMTFSGWVATVAGWYVTEIGRQPFIVYGLVRTAEVVASTVDPDRVDLALSPVLRAATSTEVLGTWPSRVLQRSRANRPSPRWRHPGPWCRGRHELDDLRRALPVNFMALMGSMLIYVSATATTSASAC
jgi:hypothetical protein